MRVRAIGYEVMVHRGPGECSERLAVDADLGPGDNGDRVFAQLKRFCELKLGLLIQSGGAYESAVERRTVFADEANGLCEGAGTGTTANGAGDFAPDFGEHY